MNNNSKFNAELYSEMLEDNGCQYDPELKQEVAEYYLNVE